MPLLVINEEPVEEKHVSWFVRDSNGFAVQLYEVVELKYKHPQAPDDAFVYKFETKCCGNFFRVEPKAATLVLLEASEKAVQQVFKDHSF